MNYFFFQKLRIIFVFIFLIEGDSLENSRVSSNVSFLLENLKPNTNYTAYVRAYSSSASDISEQLVFRTDEDGKLFLFVFNV